MDLPLYLLSTHGVGREETEKSGKAKGDVGSLCARRMAIGRTEMDYKSNYRIGFRCRRCCLYWLRRMAQPSFHRRGEGLCANAFHPFISIFRYNLCENSNQHERCVYICWIELKSFIQIHCCHCIHYIFVFIF